MRFTEYLMIDFFLNGVYFSFLSDILVQCGNPIPFLQGLNSYLEFLFEIIVERGPSVGLNVSLSRFDFFHGHLFITKDSGRVGIL